MQLVPFFFDARFDRFLRLELCFLHTAAANHHPTFPTCCRGCARLPSLEHKAE
jgi:hypothetical protein